MTRFITRSLLGAILVGSLLTGTSFAQNKTLPEPKLDPKEARIAALETSVAELIAKLTEVNTRLTALEVKLAPKPTTKVKPTIKAKPRTAPLAPPIDKTKPLGSPQNPIRTSGPAGGL